MDWSKVDPKWVAYTADRFGMQAYHSEIPTYFEKSGKWVSAGERLELGLMEITHEFNASSMIMRRPGVPIPQPAPKLAARPKSEVPKDAKTPTPVDHRVSSPREMELQTPDSKILIADMALMISDLAATVDLHEVDRRRIASIEERVRSSIDWKLPLLTPAAKTKKKTRKSSR